MSKTTNAATFTAEAITINGLTLPATYAYSSDCKAVSARVAMPDGSTVRLVITPETPCYKDACAVAKAARSAKMVKPAAVTSAKPAPVEQDAAAAEPQEKAQPTTAKPVEEKQATSAPAAKEYAGTSIQGTGWRIVFDADAGRTRVICADPMPEAKKAIEEAGFFWSSAMKSWNKRLTNKAHKAALALAPKLAAIMG